MNLNEIAKEVHENSIEKGWWEDERSFAEIIALCHSELSEALEEYRNNRPMFYVDDFENETRITDIENFGNKKPEGIATELADCVIRIFDYCSKAGIDIDGTLPWLEPQKITCTLPELITECHCKLSYAYSSKNNRREKAGYLITCMLLIFAWCGNNGIDIEEIIRIKHEYNRTRTYKHGNKVI